MEKLNFGGVLISSTILTSG